MPSSTSLSSSSPTSIISPDQLEDVAYSPVLLPNHGAGTGRGARLEEDSVLKRFLQIKFISSKDQLADIFTKSLRSPRITYICDKMDAYDIYAPP
jgi:hypothetical protein